MEPVFCQLAAFHVDRAARLAAAAARAVRPVLPGGGNRARGRFDGDGAGPGKTLDLLHQDYRYVFPIGGFVIVAAALPFYEIYLFF